MPGFGSGSSTRSSSSQSKKNSRRFWGFRWRAPTTRRPDAERERARSGRRRSHGLHGTRNLPGNVVPKATSRASSSTSQTPGPSPEPRRPAKGTYYYLYVLLDLYSRYVVGWMLAHRESGALASRLIGESCQYQGIEPSRLSLHSDRGPSMTSQSGAMLSARLGIQLSHNRPYVSNDNPFSEAQFKTLKSRPEFPDRFGAYEHALSVCRELFHWYNHEHHHSSIGLMTPAIVHYGHAPRLLDHRREGLTDAFRPPPERSVPGTPEPPSLPQAVGINPPPEKR